MPRCWKGDSDGQSNFRLKRNNADAGGYCGLEPFDSGAGGGAGSAGSGSSSTRSSPESSVLDITEAGRVKHEYQLLPEPSLLTHTLLGALPDDCSLLDIGGSFAGTLLCFC